MRNLLIFLLSFIVLESLSQTQSYIWRSPVLATDSFYYWTGSVNPPMNWRDTNFIPNKWQKGIGGFGYGDNDDNTVINNAKSIFIRKDFNIEASDSVSKLYFQIDYDDAYVAFLNGVEIGRNNIINLLPDINEFATTDHEAQLYSGGLPDQISLSKIQIKNFLKVGSNTLAVQVHNVNSTSSDLSCLPFITVGYKGDSTNYHPTPNWFKPPFTFNESNLSIISINTNDQIIVDDPEITAKMDVFYNENGKTNSIEDSPYFSGMIHLELRGESSLFFDKKSYKIETVDSLDENLNISLLGLPSENDWVFYGPYSDKSLLRNAITFDLAKSLNVYSSNTIFFELVIDDDYKGIYLLMEKIKQDKNRLDINKLTLEDTTQESISGGYIVRIDKIESSGSPGFYSEPSPKFENYDNNYFQFYDPKEENLNSFQQDYISDYLEKAESALSSQSFLNTQHGYKNYFDVASFVDYQIINELTKNVDGYRFSTYFFKDENDLLKAGPIWDFNLAYGNVDYWNNSYDIDGWIYNSWTDRLWWTKRMMQDYSYLRELHCQWIKLRQGAWSNISIERKIDSLVTNLGPAIERNFKRWEILGTYVWPNKFVGQTHDEEIQFLKDWMIERAKWLDTKWIIPCASSSIPKSNSLPKAEIFPNPFQNSINLIGSKDYRVIIHNISGKVVYEGTFNHSLDLSFLKSGFFTLSLISKDGVFSYPLIKY